MENSFNKKSTTIRWDGKKEHNNPNAYHDYSSNKKPQIINDISADIPKIPRKRIPAEPDKKVWDGNQADKQPEYGTRKFADIENPKNTVEEYPLVINANKDPEYKNLSNEDLERRFYTVRERQKSDVIIDSHEFQGKNDYRTSYKRLSKEMLRRGLLEESKTTHVDKSLVNVQERARDVYNRVVKDQVGPEDSTQSARLLDNQENIKKFADDIVGAIYEKQEQEIDAHIKTLGHETKEFTELENTAKQKFQALNKVIRDLKSQGIDYKTSPNEAYSRARLDWMNAKARVEAYEELYKNQN